MTEPDPSQSTRMDTEKATEPSSPKEARFTISLRTWIALFAVSFLAWTLLIMLFNYIF